MSQPANRGEEFGPQAVSARPERVVHRCALLCAAAARPHYRSRALQGGDAALRWADPAALGHGLAFDHERLLAAAVAVLRERVERSTLPRHLLSEKFTLTELQRTCKAILGRSLDKGAFRRRLRGSEDLVPVDEFVRGGQRPAQLFRAGEGFRF